MAKYFDKCLPFHKFNLTILHKFPDMANFSWKMNIQLNVIVSMRVCMRVCVYKLDIQHLCPQSGTPGCVS